MHPDDCAGLLALEAENPSPWTAEQLLEECRREDGWSLVALAGRAGDEPVGFVCGRIGAGEAELLKIAVLATWRRRGLGALLLGNSLSLLDLRGVDRCFLELRASNHPALALYLRAGFAGIGLRKGYYQAPPEDAVIMEWVRGRSRA